MTKLGVIFTADRSPKDARLDRASARTDTPRPSPGSRGGFRELMDAETLPLGRVTYEEFAKGWPTMDDTGKIESVNRMAKHVVSLTLRELEWNNAHVLVDEYRLTVFPCVLGAGKRLFADATAAAVLALAESRPFGNDGVIVLTYRPKARS